VGEKLGERLVVGGLHPLVIPIDRFEFLHQRDDRPMPIDRGLRQLVGVFVKLSTRSSHVCTFRVRRVGGQSRLLTFYPLRRRRTHRLGEIHVSGL